MSTESEDLIRRALQARREKRLSDACQHLLEAAELLRPGGPNVELAHVLRLLGEIERTVPDPALARQHYEEAVAILRNIDEPLKFAHALRHLGDVHRDAGRTALAEPCYLEALTVYRDHEGTRPLELANAIRSLAILKDETGERDEGRVLWAEADELYRAAGVTAGAAECAIRLGRTPGAFRE